MSFLVCLPSVYPPYTEACWHTMSPAIRTRTQVIDNANGLNLGVSRSWNRTRARVVDQGADWLVLCSAAIRFGPSQGHDFLDHLDDSGHGIVESGDATEEGNMGWHLIGLRRDVLERVGAFDEQWFAYMEDVDYGWRCQLAYGTDDAYRAQVAVRQPSEARLASVAHGIQLAHVDISFIDGERRFANKWLTEPYIPSVTDYNRPGGRGEHLSHPYDRPELDWTYTGAPVQRHWFDSAAR